MIWMILTWLGFFFATCVAIYVIVGGYLYVTSPKVRCLLHTGHRNDEALGSGLYEDGPHFLYRCRDCGHVWREPWE